MNLTDRKFERILLIKLSAIGDVIHTVPLFKALRRRYPSARIDWISKPTPAKFLSDLPGIDNVIVYGENQTEVPQYNWDGFTHFVRLIRDHRFVGMLSRLRSARYDLVIDMQGQLRSGFVSMVTGSPVRMGFERPRKAVWETAGKLLPEGSIQRAWKGSREGAWLAYTHPISLPTLDLHPIDRNLLAADLLGIPSQPADCQIPVRPEAAQRIDELLREKTGDASRPPILLTPGTLWETKHWLPEGFASVARHFLARGFPVILTGAPNEADKCQRIADAAPGAVVLQTTLPEMAALMQRSSLVLANDSGPMHMATALGKTAFAVFGPTNPRWVGPYKRPDLVVSAGVQCSPCFLRDLVRCKHDHACMRDISAEKVIDAMENSLAES